MSEAGTVAVDWVTDLIERIFVAVGFSEPAAHTVAESLVDADRRGIGSHGALVRRVEKAPWIWAACRGCAAWPPRSSPWAPCR